MVLYVAGNGILFIAYWIGFYFYCNADAFADRYGYCASPFWRDAEFFTNPGIFNSWICGDRIPNYKVYINGEYYQENSEYDINYNNNDFKLSVEVFIGNKKLIYYALFIQSVQEYIGERVK